MGLEKEIVGTGVTEKERLKSTPGGMTAEEAFQFHTAIEAAQTPPIVRNGQKSAAVLLKSGLPNCVVIQYEKEDIAHWHDIEQGTVEGPASCVHMRFDDSTDAWELPADCGWIVTDVESYVIEVRGYSYDSPEGYAASYIKTFYEIQRHHYAGNTDRAVQEAFGLGSLVAEGRFKVDWEEAALFGRSRIKRQRDFAQERGEQQTEAREEHWNRWRQHARKVLQEDERYRRARMGQALARKVKKDLGLEEKPEAVYKRIKSILKSN